MSVHKFKYYMHSNYEATEEVEYLMSKGLPHNIADRLADRFDEVSLDMEYDDQTDTLTCTKAELL